jgi:acyl-CoA dehydrogenase
LSLTDGFELLELCGAFAQPLPLAESLLARAGLDTRHSTVAACVDAALLSGAMQSVLQMTLQFANQRVQFGRPIAKFQAVQHQLAVMAEHALAAQMAARIGCTGPQPDLLRVAVAKARCAEAAVEVAAIAHAVHGAIGFTAELDLQLFTRRLHHWRQRSGTESYWHGVLGQACLDSNAGCSLDLIRSLSP